MDPRPTLSEPSNFSQQQPLAHTLVDSILYLLFCPGYTVLPPPFSPRPFGTPVPFEILPLTLVDAMEWLWYEYPGYEGYEGEYPVRGYKYSDEYPGYEGVKIRGTGLCISGYEKINIRGGYPGCISGVYVWGIRSCISGVLRKA